MNKKYQVHIYLETLITAFGFIFWGCYLIFQFTYTEKSDFEKVTGRLVLLSQTFEDLPYQDLGKIKFLQLDSYPKVFQIFTGPKEGASNPKIERIDELKTGDTLTVFYAKPTMLEKQDPRVNNLAVYVDKGKEPYFEADKTTDIYVGFFVAGIGLLLFVANLYLKKKGFVV